MDLHNNIKSLKTSATLAINELSQKLIADDKTLCQKILNDTGFAMLPGSDFGMEEDKLLSRIAFVDFDGSKALEMIQINQRKIARYDQVVSLLKPDW